MLSLDIFDSRIAKDSNITNLKEWLDENVKIIVNKIFKYKTYVEIVLETAYTEDYADNYKNKIYTQIENLVTNNGYRIEQKLIKPELPELDWLKRVSVQSINTYQTKNRDIPIEVEVSIDGKVSDLRSDNIKNYISPDFKLNDEIKLILEKDIEIQLRSISSEIVIGNFYDSIESKIIKKLSKKLENQFSLKDISIDVRPGPNNDFDKRIKELELKKGNFEVKILPQEITSEDELIIFKGTFRIDGVYDLTMFARRKHSVSSTFEIIKSSIEGFLNELLPFFSKSDLISSDFQIHTSLKKKVSEELYERIGKELGVRVLIENFISIPKITQDERISIGQGQIKKKLKEVIELKGQIFSRSEDKLRKLYLKREALEYQVEEGFGDKKELKILKKKIKKTEEKLFKKEKTNQSTLKLSPPLSSNQIESAQKDEDDS